MPQRTGLAEHAYLVAPIAGLPDGEPGRSARITREQAPELADC
ncbi:hypothetical protein [Streptomyces sp. NPDC052036]